MVRLGDYIDDYCTRCKRSTDHSIAAIVGDEVQKVACRICHTEHPFRHNDSGKPTKEQAFNKLLETAKGQIDSASGKTPAGTPAATAEDAPAKTPAKAKRTRK
jgi:hypothetical protein